MKYRMENLKQFCEKEPYWTGFFTGVLIGSFLAGPILFIMSLLRGDYKPPVKFEAIGTYKNCEIVRFAPEDSVQHHYLTYCPNTTNTTNRSK